MNYSNTSVRRQDRLLDKKSAELLLTKGEYGVLSMIDENDRAYGIPISFVWNEHSSIYLHCSPEGRKLHCIGFNNKVSFCVVGRTNVIPDKFSTEYESIILECSAKVGLPSDEKMKALVMLIDKYSPEFKDNGLKYIESLLNRTEIIRLDIQQWSGKCRKA